MDQRNTSCSLQVIRNRRPLTGQNSLGNICRERISRIRVEVRPKGVRGNLVPSDPGDLQHFAIGDLIPLTHCGATLSKRQRHRDDPTNETRCVQNYFLTHECSLVPLNYKCQPTLNRVRAARIRGLFFALMV